MLTLDSVLDVVCEGAQAEDSVVIYDGKTLRVDKAESVTTIVLKSDDESWRKVPFSFGTTELADGTPMFVACPLDADPHALAQMLHDNVQPPMRSISEGMVFVHDGFDHPLSKSHVQTDVLPVLPQGFDITAEVSLKDRWQPVENSIFQAAVAAKVDFGPDTITEIKPDVVCSCPDTPCGGVNARPAAPISTLTFEAEAPAGSVGAVESVVYVPEKLTPAERMKRMLAARRRK